MIAVWLENRRLRVRRDLPVPTPAPGEALVRVLRAGICSTDLELMRGYYPYTGILGHEFAGVVERGPSELLGQRVVGEINAVCHDCEACRVGRERHCNRRTVLGIVNRPGAFAEYLTLPVENLHRIPAGLSDETATFTEPLAAALEIQEQVAISGGDRVLVIGDGKLGQLVARTLVLTGCDLMVVGRHAEKLEMMSHLGIRTGTVEDIVDQSFDRSVECTGNPEGFGLARRALRPRGTLIMKSTYAGALSIDASSLVVDEITLIGSRCGPFRPALDLLAAGHVEVGSLIHGRYALAESLAAFEHAQRSGVLKVLLDCTSDADVPRIGAASNGGSDGP